MASVSLAEARAYLGIDGDDHDVYLAGMRNLAERYIRRLTIIGDGLHESGNSYAHLFPDDLQLAQLLMIKFYFDRRESPNDAKSPPGLAGYLTGWERGVGNDNEMALRVHTPDEPAAVEPDSLKYFAAIPAPTDLSTPADEVAALFDPAAFLAGTSFTGLRITVGGYAVESVEGFAVPATFDFTALIAEPDALPQNVTTRFPRQTDIVIDGETYRRYIAVSSFEWIFANQALSTFEFRV